MRIIAQSPLLGKGKAASWFWRVDTEQPLQDVVKTLHAREFVDLPMPSSPVCPTGLVSPMQEGRRSSGMRRAWDPEGGVLCGAILVGGGADHPLRS